MQRIFVEARKVGTTCYPIPCLLTDTWDVEFGWICLSCSINFLKGLHPVPLTNVHTKAEPASRNDWHFIKMVTTSWVKKAALLSLKTIVAFVFFFFFFFNTLKHECCREPLHSDARASWLLVWFFMLVCMALSAAAGLFTKFIGGCRLETYAGAAINVFCA